MTRKSDTIRRRQFLHFLIAAFLCISHSAWALYQPPYHPQEKAGAFATPLTDALIDDSATVEQVGSTPRPLADPSLLRKTLWTQTTNPQTAQCFWFGDFAGPGQRYLRLGFKSPIPIGSVLVREDGQLSALRPGASYPGNLADDSQWIPAQRILNRQSTTSEVDGPNYALWVLPPGAETRALRFAHTSTQADAKFAGSFCSLYLLSGRFANLAPESNLFVSANQDQAKLLTDLSYDGWSTWDNGPSYSHPVTPQTPEWIVLSWPHTISLSGLAALWAGFDSADVETFTGAQTENPQVAPEKDWQPIGHPLALRNQYPLQLGVDWIDFGKIIQTRAVRLRITGVTDENHHPHLKDKTRSGNRVWLGELMALSPLPTGDLTRAIAAINPPQAVPTAPIPIHFSLDKPGNVTLVIDDAKGNRVRNLISDTPFPAGSNTVYWDGTDDLKRDSDAAAHGIYRIPTEFVSPGQYQVRGLVHQPIDLRYEFSVYSGGSPAWDTADGTGGWLANHTPPSSALFVPADKAPGGKPLVYLGSYVTEGGAGLAWVDLDGNKQGGKGWIGGNWTGAPYIARDAGAKADPKTIIYVASVWGDNQSNPESKKSVNLRVTAITSGSDRPVLKYAFQCGDTPGPYESGGQFWARQIGGLAVHDGLVFVSLTKVDQIIVANATSGAILGSITVHDPRGLAFDTAGRLLALSEHRLLRFAAFGDASGVKPAQAPAPQSIIESGLEDPVGITLDTSGNIYISDRGNSNQVKVFKPNGQPLRTIGHPGPSVAGPYDPLHMNNPRGLTIDSNHRLWVAEEDFQPKRISVWNLDDSSTSQLVKAFYGPSEYGGGGSLDPRDKSLFYYHGMEFKLDWQTGTSKINSVLYRPSANSLQSLRYIDPVNVLYSNGHRYFTNSFLGYTVGGPSIGVLYLDEGGVVHPVAAFGKANDWPLFQDPSFRASLPPGADLSSRMPNQTYQFSWTDLNHDGNVEPSEVAFVKQTTGTITIEADSKASGPVILDSNVAGQAVRYAPVKVTAEGIPTYDLTKPEVLVEGAQIPASDGGGQIITSPKATVLTTAPLPFARESLGGVDAQGHRWSYPSPWPGLHPAHSAPVADQPGEIIGTTRLLGDFIHAPNAQVGDLWGINGNFGPMYIFTADGLFVTQLLQDVRVGKPWNMPQATRNMLLNDITPHDENFFPSLAQTPDGKVYIDDGGRTSLLRVDGLESLRRLPNSTIEVTAADLDKARTYLMQSEELRQQVTGPKALVVGILPAQSLPLKDVLNKLSTASWATIDSRITQIGWGRKPDVTEAAIAISGDRLYAAFRNNEPNLLRNSGALQNAPFKTGGALDLFIGTDPHADPNRKSPVVGDIRLLVYQVNQETKAILYKAVVPGTSTPVPFSSPDRVVKIDQVIDVSSSVQLDSETGAFVFSIPLATLGLIPKAGESIKADIGILRGNGTQTTQRVYWSNKATGITSDVPSEAALTPELWGTWVFKSEP